MVKAAHIFEHLTVVTAHWGKLSFITNEDESVVLKGFIGRQSLSLPHPCDSILEDLSVELRELVDEECVAGGESVGVGVGSLVCRNGNGTDWKGAGRVHGVCKGGQQSGSFVRGCHQNYAISECSVARNAAGDE
jgi:hypothetical protein